MMTVGDLKNILDSLEDDVEVRVAYQPSYPLEMNLAEYEYTVKDGVLFLSEAGGGYLTEGIASELGWR